MKSERYLWVALAVTAAAYVVVPLPSRRLAAQIDLASAAPTTSPAAGRKLHAPPRPGEIREMTIQELGNFDYNPDASDPIPADVRRLDGMRVRLRGFMISIDETEKISRFAFVPTLGSCCYGQPPALQHIIVVNCSKGHEVELHGEMMVLEGALQVKETKVEGYVVSLFQVSCDKLRPAPEQ